MKKHINRRQALATGALSAGALAGISPQNADAANTPFTHYNNFDDSHIPPFLTPWSPPKDRKKDLTPGNTPIRLAAFTGDYMLEYSPGMDIGAKVEKIRAAGYTATNSHPGRLNRNPWLDAPDSAIRELKDALRANDVLFADMHCNANNMHPDPEERRKERQWCYWQMEAAEKVGCPLISTHIGSMAPSAIAPHKDNWTWECWKLSVETMNDMIRHTEGMNVALALEPDPMVQINCVAAHRQIMDECGPRVKVCYDPINMMNLSVHYRTTELINESFDILGEDILIAHAKDTYILPDKMSVYLTQVLQGTGQLDYETYLVRLSRMKYPRALLIEHIAREDYPKATKFVRDTAAKVGVKIHGD